jgi:hypothetical protein
MATAAYFRSIDLAALTQVYLEDVYSKLVNPLPIDINTITTEASVVIESKPTTRNAKNEFTKSTGQNFAMLGFRPVQGCKYAYINPKETANCMYCLRKVDPEHALGIPISKDYKIVPGKTIYYTVDIFCYFGCCYNEMCDRIKMGDELYSSSTVYLSEIFEAVTGLSIKHLKAVPDKRLLKVFNGEMDHDTFHKCDKYYPKNVNIMYVPVMQYIEG